MSILSAYWIRKRITYFLKRGGQVFSLWSIIFHSFCRNMSPSTMDHWALLASSPWAGLPLIYPSWWIGPDDAHYIKVLRSSRKSPTSNTPHLLFFPLSTGWSFLPSIFSSSVLPSETLSSSSPPSPFPTGLTDNLVVLLLKLVLVILGVTHLPGLSLEAD